MSSIVMEEINFRLNTLEELCSQIHHLIENLNQSSQPSQDMENIENKFEVFTTHLESVRMEVKSLPKLQYKSILKQCRQYKKQLREFQNEYQWRRPKVQNSTQLLLYDHKEHKEGHKSTSINPTQAHKVDIGIEMVRANRRSIEVKSGSSAFSCSSLSSPGTIEVIDRGAHLLHQSHNSLVQSQIAVHSTIKIGSQAALQLEEQEQQLKKYLMTKRSLNQT